jgi:putative acetyltransferase
MIEITPMQPEYIAQAKNVIYRVAHTIFGREQTLEEFIATAEHDRELADVENYQAIYSENRGLFLMVREDEKVIGTGGIRKLRENTAELKRIWLLEEYHGQQIGFQVVSTLLNFAREHGYIFAYLETTRLNKRALGFYQKLGFRQVPSPYDDADEISMEMPLVYYNNFSVR